MHYRLPFFLAGNMPFREHHKSLPALPASHVNPELRTRFFLRSFNREDIHLADRVNAFLFP
jgi:hypothetical protein